MSLSAKRKCGSQHAARQPSSLFTTSSDFPCVRWKHHLFLSQFVTPCQKRKYVFLVNWFLFVVAGANQKSSSHFHCLKCDYYCTDTNKVRRGCIFCAYSLVLQCNIVTHVARQQKVREGKRQRKDEDKLHFANWNWELKQISPGGGAQEAASEVGQHHGCRWLFDLSSFLHTFAYFLLFTYLIYSGFEKFTPTQYCSTPGCSHNGKQTHYHCRWTLLLF